MEAETLRNPNLVSRLRSVLGIEDHSPGTALKDDKFIIGSVELEKMKSKICLYNLFDTFNCFPV